MEFLYSMGIGISFSIGIGVGALLCRIAQKEGRDELRAMFNEHNKTVENRLEAYVMHTSRLQTALSKLTGRSELWNGGTTG